MTSGDKDERQIMNRPEYMSYNANTMQSQSPILAAIRAYFPIAECSKQMCRHDFEFWKQSGATTDRADDGSPASAKSRVPVGAGVTFARRKT